MYTNTQALGNNEYIINENLHANITIKFLKRNPIPKEFCYVFNDQSKMALLYKSKFT